jgi:hypothetical protein
MFFFAPDGQAFGPYIGRGPDGTGEFWTNTVFSSEGVLVLRHYGPDGAADLQSTSFRVIDAGYISPRFVDQAIATTESFCSFNVPCIENASCHNGTPADAAKDAIALMQWISGAFIYTCTGGLVADMDSGSQIPYFLTAHHCISRNKDAKNLETYFQFSIACGSSNCPGQTNPGGIQRLGASVLASSTGGDFTLLQLNQNPPSGSTFLGWNNTPVANSNNVQLYRISHPAWAPQAYSEQHVNTSAGTCTQLPRGEFIYSTDDVGGTEGGSSGGPVVNGAGEIVGQLYGACGTNINDECDSQSNATVDGALAYYFSSVEQYLGTPVSCTPSPEDCTDGQDNDCDGAVDCDDSDCSGDPACAVACINPGGLPVGASCTSDSDCCGDKCKGGPGNKSCK